MLMAAQAGTAYALQCELRKKGQIPLDVYEVLTTLHEAPDRKLRMSELAERILFSRSGLTRLVDRLQARGWVEREPCADDRRGWYTKLTESGELVREQAFRCYMPGLQTSWSLVLDEKDHSTLLAILGKVHGHNRGRKKARLDQTGS